MGYVTDWDFSQPTWKYLGNFKDNNPVPNPDAQHFDKLRLNEVVQKLDKIWAKVPNESHNDLDNSWTASKAREESKKLLNEYFG